MAGKQISRQAAHGGVGMREQGARARVERRIRRGHDPLQRLQRLRDDAPVGVSQLRLQTVTRMRRAECFGGNAAPAPVGVATDRRSRGDPRRAVGLRQRDDGLPSESKDAAGETGP